MRIAPKKNIVRLYHLKLPPRLVAILKKEYEHQETATIMTMARMVANFIYICPSCRRRFQSLGRALFVAGRGSPGCLVPLWPARLLSRAAAIR